MKNLPGNFLAKLIASMPLEAIRTTTQVETRRRGKKMSRHESNETALNTIFMVRYRIQHL